MNTLYYLLEANIYLVVFYGLYKLCLHRETFYSLNRYFLLCTTIVAFVLPFFQMGYLHQLFGARETYVQLTVPSAQPASTDESIQRLFIIFYLLVCAGFAFMLAFNLFKLLSVTRKAPKQREGTITMVMLPESESAFSFFNFLFINPMIKEKETVLIHEMVHIRQKHSIDILFFEVIRILCWFNPLVWMMKKDISLLHEYLADEQCTDFNKSKHDYALFLIRHSFGMVPNQLANHIFNQSILKRRINMLNQEKSTRRSRLKLLFVVPVIAGMVCSSTLAFSKDYALDLYPQKADYTKSVQDTLRKKTIRKKIAPPPPPVEAPPKSGKHKIAPPPPPVAPPAPQEAIAPPPPPIEAPPKDKKGHLKKKILFPKPKSHQSGAKEIRPSQPEPNGTTKKL